MLSGVCVFLGYAVIYCAAILVVPVAVYPADFVAKKAHAMFKIYRQTQNFSQTFGCLDPVQLVQMCKYLTTIYVSGWQCSSTASTTNEPGPGGSIVVFVVLLFSPPHHVLFRPPASSSVFSRFLAAYGYFYRVLDNFSLFCEFVCRFLLPAFCEKLFLSSSSLLFIKKGHLKASMLATALFYLSLIFSLFLFFVERILADHVASRDVTSLRFYVLCQKLVCIFPQNNCYPSFYVSQ